MFELCESDKLKAKKIKPTKQILILHNFMFKL